MTDDADPLRLENQVCFAIVRAAKNVVSIYRPILEPLGLTHPQYLVMLALWERAPRSLTALSAAVAMDAATLSPLVKRLEAQGLVARARSTADERALEIGLTDAGRALRTRALEVPGAVMASLGIEAAALAGVADALAPFTDPDRIGRRAQA